MIIILPAIYHSRILSAFKATARQQNQNFVAKAIPCGIIPGLVFCSTLPKASYFKRWAIVPSVLITSRTLASINYSILSPYGFKTAIL
ncbi:MAG: hypothetical protein JW956_02120, partial [Calditrichaceae bacterium]|nr:hypothetical protein [Calditrichaceae bacterium]